MIKVSFHFCALILSVVEARHHRHKHGIEAIDFQGNSTKQYWYPNSNPQSYERAAMYEKILQEERDGDRINDENGFSVNAIPIKDIISKSDFFDNMRLEEMKNEDKIRDPRYSVKELYSKDSEKDLIRRESENKLAEASRERKSKELRSEWYKLRDCKCKGFADESSSDVRRSPSTLREYTDKKISSSSFRKKEDTETKPAPRSKEQPQEVSFETPTYRFDGILNRETRKEHRPKVLFEDTKEPRHRMRFDTTSRPVERVKYTSDIHRRSYVPRFRINRRHFSDKRSSELALDDEFDTNKHNSVLHFDNKHKELLDTLSGALNNLGHEVKQLSKKVVDHEIQLEQHEKRLNDLENNIAQEMQKLCRNGCKTNAEPKENCRAPPYDGTTSFTSYIDQFEAMAMENDWSKDKALTTLISALRKNALEVLDNIGDDFSYEELVEALNKKFGKKYSTKHIIVTEKNPRHKADRDIPERLSQEREEYTIDTKHKVRINSRFRSEEMNSAGDEDRRGEATELPNRGMRDSQSRYEEDMEDPVDRLERYINPKIINVEMQLTRKRIT